MDKAGKVFSKWTWTSMQSSRASGSSSTPAKLNPFQEAWKKYEGSIITGIKLAEKQIPHDTPNAGLAKLDAALRFVLNASAEANNGKQPSAKLVEQIKQGIQITHNDLDRFGGLSKSKAEA